MKAIPLLPKYLPVNPYYAVDQSTLVAFCGRQAGFTAFWLLLLWNSAQATQEVNRRALSKHSNDATNDTSVLDG